MTKKWGKGMERSHWTGAMVFLGHYQVPLYLAAVAFAAAQSVLTQLDVIEFGPVMTAAPPATTAAVMLVGFVHDRRLCGRCIAEFPLDPGRAVERHRSTLRRFHRVMEDLLRRAFLWLIAPLVLMGAAKVTGLPTEWAAAAGLPWIFAGSGYLLLLSRRHQKLRLYCPWCRGWGGGGGDEGPEGPGAPEGPTHGRPVPRLVEAGK